MAEYQELLTQNGMDAQAARQMMRSNWRNRWRWKSCPDLPKAWYRCRTRARKWRRRLLDVRDGMRVLDACAAPGGKSAHLLELAEVELTALDNDIARVARITQNLSRLGLNANHVMHGDAPSPREMVGR